MVVNLTETESKICTNLDDFCKQRAQERPEEEPVVCRIAGGWVRDKVGSLNLPLRGRPVLTDGL